MVPSFRYFEEAATSREKRPKAALRAAGKPLQCVLRCLPLQAIGEPALFLQPLIRLGQTRKSVDTVRVIATLLPFLLRAQIPADLARPAVTRFRVDPSRSIVRFDAAATGHTVHGVTHQVAGEVVFDPDDLTREAEVAFQVDAVALDTGNKIRDRKMRDSHLETGRYPTIAFRSSGVRAIAPTLRPGETQELTVKGTLSLHGVDKLLTFPVKAVRHGKDLRVTGEVPLRLSDFAIPIPRFLFIKLQDEVKVMFE